MASASRRLILSSAIAATMLATLLPAAAIAATRPITFELYPGGSCINGRASDRVAMRVVWRSASGTLKLREDIRTSSNGYWELCAGASKRLRVGDSIKATVGTTSRTFVVPNVTLTMNRVTNYFKGTAPANTNVYLTYQQGLFGDTETSKTVVAGSDGQWRYRKAGYDIIGGQYAYLRWRSASNDVVTVSNSAPYAIVTLGKPSFSGVAKAAGTSISASLTNTTTGAVRATANSTANADGAFVGRFRNPSGNLVNAVAGNRLKSNLAGDADWIIPNITGNASAATDVVAGRCHDAGTSQRFFWLEVYDSTKERTGQALGSTDTTGRFTVNMADPATADGVTFWDATDLRSGDKVRIRCLQTTGDWVHREITVP